MITTRMLLGAIFALLACQAHAERPYFGDTFAFKIGGMEQYSNVTFSSTRDGRPERELDLKDLGMSDDASTVYASAAWQFFDSWGIGLSYSSFDTDGMETASEGGNFGDIEWTADATLSSFYDLDLYILDLHWDFINNGRTNVGVGLGLHVADIKTGIAFELESTINGRPVIVDSGSETAEVTAPLPDVQVRFGHRFGDNFHLSATAGYFALKVNDIDGELVSARAAFEWRPVKHFGLGVGYQYINVDITEDKNDRKNKLDTDIYGPVLFVSAGF